MIKEIEMQVVSELINERMYKVEELKRISEMLSDMLKEFEKNQTTDMEEYGKYIRTDGDGYWYEYKLNETFEYMEIIDCGITKED